MDPRTGPAEPVCRVCQELKEGNSSWGWFRRNPPTVFALLSHLLFPLSDLYGCRDPRDRDKKGGTSREKVRFTSSRGHWEHVLHREALPP